jgi:hypothetical protein
MPSLFQILLGIHITGGSIGLISGTISIAVKKGGKLHRLAGKFFFWGMFLASLDALVLSNLPEHHNLFLFAVGGFTLYMICSGFRIVHLKRLAKQQEHPFGNLDYAIAIFGLGFGGYLLFLSTMILLEGNSFGIVPGAFGLICLNYARMDFQLLFRKKTLKMAWMSSHITRMMGAMIASYTAFLVVNIKFQPAWVLWLLPTMIGSGLIAYYLRKFTPKKKGNAV